MGEEGSDFAAGVLRHDLRLWRQEEKQRIGKAGEIQRRKATELRRQPDNAQEDAMSAGLHF